MTEVKREFLPDNTAFFSPGTNQSIRVQPVSACAARRPKGCVRITSGTLTKIRTPSPARRPASAIPSRRESSVEGQPGHPSLPPQGARKESGSLAFTPSKAKTAAPREDRSPGLSSACGATHSGRSEPPGTHLGLVGAVSPTLGQNRSSEKQPLRGCHLFTSPWYMCKE